MVIILSENKPCSTSCILLVVSMVSNNVSSAVLPHVVKSIFLMMFVVVNAWFCVCPGAGSVLRHSDAGPFPVSFTSVAKGPACGPELPGRGSCSGSRALRQRPLPKLRPGAPNGAGRSLSLMERCSWGMQPLGQESFQVLGHGNTGFVVWGQKAACYTFLMNTSCEISSHNFLFPLCQAAARLWTCIALTAPL